MTVVEERSSVPSDVVEAVKKGECILFLGAAVHAPPPAQSRFTYPEEERPPLGATFSVKLAEQCEQLQGRDENVKNLARIAHFFETEKSRGRLVAEIEAAVQTGRKPSPALRGLASLDFPAVITTNYDRLFERALTDAGKDPFISIYSPRDHERTDDYPSLPTSERPFVIKIHGDVGRPDSIVVTDEDYIQFVRRMTESEPFNPVPITFKYFFRKWMTLFVGYSLVDYNLRLLFKTLRWQIDQASFPDTYSVDLNPDPCVVDALERKDRYVRFIAEDVWSFVPDLYYAVKGEVMPDFRD